MGKTVDDKTHITETTKQGWNSLTSWYNRSGLGDTTKQVGTVISSSVRNLDAKLHVSETAGEVGRGVKGLDEKTKISETVTGGLATSMEFISSKVCATNDNISNADNFTSDTSNVNSIETDEKPKDDFPSSFQK